ncbi:TPR repeat [Micromonospora yangpuensis]|uniref:TPR repeat n=1 Tax=Micromonospora yangpuensis TaxID=683228 RepID=A0A1C6U3V8_9ACTN|nr:TPR repeat [Micromonospora yangpuensis]
MVLAQAAGRRDTAAIAADIGAFWTRAGAAGTSTDSRFGQPVRHCDPLALEVHPAIQVGRPLPPLPPYVERRHDRELAKVVSEACSGRSRIAMLVGASSTGKTRACWEAIQHLPAQWRVWHPFDPTRPDAADQHLEQVPAHTVVWFNEAQHYLLTADPRLGERLAARLRTLLHDQARGPVLVLGTIWPHYWDALTGPPPANDLDLRAQARDLLIGADIAVPDAWSTIEVRQLAAASDARLREAVENAEAGRITQYLAGVPELMQRYRNAPPLARAVLTAAIDARRLGHPLSLPHELLTRAAPSYLADVEWGQVSEDWWQDALSYTAKPCHGIAGPLIPIRPRPTEDATLPASYRLADFLQQRGAAERAAIFPPAGFWDAVAAAVSDPVTLRTIGDHAEHRGRYRRAAALYRLAVAGGDDQARWTLAAIRERAGDQSGATALRQGGTSAFVDEGAELSARAELRERAGDLPGAIDLYQRAANRGDAQSWDRVVSLLEQTTDPDGALEAALRAADQGHASALRVLAITRDRMGNPHGSEQVAQLAADRGDATIFGSLAATRERLGDLQGARELYQRGADHGDTHALCSLAELLKRNGLRDMAEQLYQQVIDSGTPSALVTLAALREQMGDKTAARQLYQRAADGGSTAALLSLAAAHERDGDLDEAEKRYQQAIQQGDVTGWWSLAGLRHQSGDLVGADQMYRRAADHGISAALISLAELAEERGDRVEAAEWALLATDHGDSDGLDMLIQLRRRMGDRAGANKMERFGLDDDGSPAASLE